MGSRNSLSRRALFGMMVGRKKVQAAGNGMSGIDPLAVRADRLFRAARYAEAEPLYAELLEHEPEHLEVRHQLALCLMHTGRCPQARAAWDIVLAHQPDDPAALLYKGLSYAREGVIDLALETWRRYRNYRQVELQRELNLILALADEGRGLCAQEMVERVEAALADSR
ncbi:MAG: tetratricopeptide repeat protein [Chromatocurvus sp.]